MLNKMRIAIVGGSGKMGRWFGRFLKDEGKDVILIGRNKNKLVDAAAEIGTKHTTDFASVRQADVILLSVAIEAFETVCNKLRPCVREGQFICDISSVKTMPVEVMHNLFPQAITLGTHPVFGPGAHSINKQNFVLTPTSENEQKLASTVGDFLEKRGARVITMTPKEHDQMMSIILGLSHFIAIVSADTLLSSDNYKRLEGISGVTYRVLLTLVESVLTEDPSLYGAIQMNLPRLTDTEDLFCKKAGYWAQLVRNSKREEFINQMQTLKELLKKDNPEFGQSYAEMYRLSDERSS
jgi:prephenate dehydrogenase